MIPRYLLTLNCRHRLGVFVTLCVVILHMTELPCGLADPHHLPSQSPGFESRLLSETKSFSNNPAIAASASGELAITWIRHDADTGDEVVVKLGDAGPIEIITPKRGQYLRPVVTFAAGCVHCVWTQTDHDQPSSIWHAVRESGTWSPPKRLLPGELRAHQNPEIAASASGRVAVAFQMHTGKGYEIFVKDRLGVTAVSGDSDSTNAWDPTITFRNNQWVVAWSNFFEGDYDIYYWWEQSKRSPIRISSRGQYDLHPWITCSPAGNIWVTWDAVELPGHANSGSTTITESNPQHKIHISYSS